LRATLIDQTARIKKLRDEIPGMSPFNPGSSVFPFAIEEYKD
jgi:hypothetical protein